MLPEPVAANPLSALRALLRAVPLIDGHNDLLWEMRERARYDFSRIDIAGACPTLQTDLPRLRRGGVGAQFWSVYIPAVDPFRGHAAVTATLEQLAAFHEMLARYPEHLGLARSADELMAVSASGRIASLAGMEGGHCIADSLPALGMMYQLGARYLTLTHNTNTSWADAAVDVPEHGGLTDFGRAVVAELNRLGMLVDLSHVAASTMRAALTATKAPVIFSHSSARALCAHPRNVPDDVLVQLAQNGGVCMVTFVPAFVDPAAGRAWLAYVQARDAAQVEFADDPGRLAATITQLQQAHPTPTATLAQVADHIDHIRTVAGIDHVGIGSDFDGVAVQPVGLEDVSCFPALFAELRHRGYSDEDLRKIAGRNFLRVFRAAEAVAG